MAMIYCTECGRPISDQAFACPHCGCPVAYRPLPPQYTSPVQHFVPPQGQPPYGYVPTPADPAATYVQKLAAKEQTSGIIWISISIVQLIAGAFGLWPLLIVGVLNLIGAIGSFTLAKGLQNPYYPGLVETYEKRLTSLIIALVYNVIFGGVIGIIGNIYDLSIRNFVLENRGVFEAAARRSQPQAPSMMPQGSAYPNVQGLYQVPLYYFCRPGGSTVAFFTINNDPQKYKAQDGTVTHLYLPMGEHTIHFSLNFRDHLFQFRVPDNIPLRFECTWTTIRPVEHQ